MKIFDFYTSPPSPHSTPPLPLLNQKFIQAVIQSNIPQMTECLDLGVDPNLLIEDGDAALHVSSDKCDYKMLDLLLNRPTTDLNLKNDLELTPLAVASKGNCREIAHLLLRAGADPDAQDKDGYTALHYACFAGNMGLVVDLVEAEADVNCANVFDMTPLAVAVLDVPSISIAKYLMLKGASSEAGRKQFPLLLECAFICHTYKQLNMFKLLISNGMDHHQVHPIENRNCLHYAAITGYLPLAEYLIKLNNVERDLFVRDATGRTPMDLTLDHGNYLIFHLYKFAYLKRQIRDRDRSIHRYQPHE
ncbi:unnamed protein product [Phyllotreta striolata]|uniref:Uncharacterized protein n=1 Tax=Phyllotreta striolata TaxID=444603 RepID=A0A9P0GTZ4_PHYSR|nr:unnamed protein product [Phyllotreta striolata]